MDISGNVVTDPEFLPSLKVCIALNLFLVFLFRRKSRAIVIARLSFLLLSSYKNFNAAHFSKSIKCINTKLGILAHQDNVQLQDKGHTSKSYILGVMPHILTKNLK